MRTSTDVRGTAKAAAGVVDRAVAGLPVLRLRQRVAVAWERLGSSEWGRPAAKLMLLMSLISILAWVSTHPDALSLLALRSPNVAASSVRGALEASAEGSVAAALHFVSDAGIDSQASEASAGTGTRGVLPDGRVVLNQATEEELVRLPKIGASRARAIVALRQRAGRFRSVRDLLRIKGIGPRTVQRLQSLVVLDAPRDAADAGAH